MPKQGTNDMGNAGGEPIAEEGVKNRIPWARNEGILFCLAFEAWWVAECRRLDFFIHDIIFTGVHGLTSFGSLVFVSR